MRYPHALALALALAPHASSAQAPYDVLIRGARLLDGSGNPWVHADIAVRGDRIAAVGDLAETDAARVIDARGLYVAPGFIDTHSHAGGGLADADLAGAVPLLAQGITTVFVNPDGGGPTDVAAQRGELEQAGIGVNVAQLVGHGSVRRAVIGLADRAATPQELDAMRALVRAGMEQGAFGLSSGLYYTPGSFAPLEEVIELAREVRPFGGAYTSHIRDEADYTIGVVAAVDEVIRVAREAEVPGVVTHIKALGPRVWGYAGALIQRIERARGQGVEVFADQYPYLASATGLEAALVPAWARAGGDTAFVRRLGEPETRARIRSEMVENLDRRGGAERIQFRRFEPDASIEGRTLAAVAAERGQDPIATALELIAQDGPSIVSFNMHEDDVRALMRQPWTMTASDGDLGPMNVGVPHPRSYGTFPRKLREYAVEQRVVDLAAAVRSMTSLPALVYGLADRGVIRAGAVADLLVFDLERVDDPATFTAPHQLAEGMVHVLVNGRFAIDEGRPTGERNGRVLRR
ncbi:MAG: N-acyl-D-amino-acid deacylase family protein [Longimicrobiales bacterium]